MAVFDYSRLRARLDEYATALWTVERLTVIVDEHERDLCFRVIGARLGVSKSAAISQGRRIGLPLRKDGRNGSRKDRARTTPKARAARPVAAPKPPRPPVPSALDLRHQRRPEVQAALALTALHLGRISDLGPNQCKWPVGDPKAADFGFCGRLRAGGPYCCDHQKAAVDRAVTTQSHRGGIERLAALAQGAPRRVSARTGAWA